MTEYEPGWYHVEGDPPDTMRFFDGEQIVGEAVPQDVEFAVYADPWARGLARFFDWLFTLVTSWLVVGVALPIDNAAVVVVLVGFIVTMYEVGFVALQGATPGKKMFDLDVVNHDRQSPPGWTPAVMRVVPVWILYSLLEWVLPIESWFLLAGFVLVNVMLAALTPTRSSIFDMFGRTSVVTQAPIDGD